MWPFKKAKEIKYKHIYRDFEIYEYAFEVTLTDNIKLTVTMESNSVYDYRRHPNGVGWYNRREHDGIPSIDRSSVENALQKQHKIKLFNSEVGYIKELSKTLLRVEEELDSIEVDES